MTPNTPTVKHAPPIALRLAEIADSISDPAVAALADEVRVLEDRLAYVEAALHHVAERIGLDLTGLPDPLGFRIAPCSETTGGAA